jgi:uncharacterized protein (TIGR00290 family)
MDKTPVVLSWSGGKDSALALWTLRSQPDLEVCALLTTVTEGYERISMHGVRSELLERQAASLGLALVRVPIPPQCSNELYEECMATALAGPAIAAVKDFAFGDLFLEDVRAYREERLRAVGKRCLFPLWGRDPQELAQTFIAAGFAGLLTCVDTRRLAASFAGHRYDASLLADLPTNVDPCGEHGEFHTFVCAGPIFGSPIPIEIGEVVVRDGFAFCDLKLSKERVDVRP